MGSIASHPKVPAAAQTVFVPVYTLAATASASSASPSTVQADPATASAPPAAAGQINSSLLERSRGVLSTVLTGFRGLLADNNGPQRKSLLGE